LPKPKNSLLTEEKTDSNHIYFSFAYTLGQCVTIKSKSFSFTNRIPLKELRKYRTILENALKDWSTKSIQQLEKSRKCYLVQEKDKQTKNNLTKVFQSAKYPAQWIEQNIQDPDVYKFKIDNQIRMFGIVERNMVKILLYDIWHLINKSQKKNFSIPQNLTCAWCLKGCD